MRSILLDELRASEVQAVEAYLKEKILPSGVEGIFWLPLPQELWNKTQLQERGNGDEPGEATYRLAVELGPDWLRLELLVRSETIHNLGGGPADLNQALFALKWADEMAETLGLTSCLPRAR